MAHNRAEPIALYCHRSLGDSSALWGEDRYSWWTATAHTSAPYTGSRQRSSHCTLPQPPHALSAATNTLCWLTSLRCVGFGEPASAAALQPARLRERRYQRTKKRGGSPSQMYDQPRGPGPPTDQPWVRDCAFSAGGRQRGNWPGPSFKEHGRHAPSVSPESSALGTSKAKRL